MGGPWLSVWSGRLGRRDGYGFGLRCVVARGSRRRGRGVGWWFWLCGSDGAGVFLAGMAA